MTTPDQAPDPQETDAPEKSEARRRADTETLASKLWGEPEDDDA